LYISNIYCSYGGMLPDSSSIQPYNVESTSQDFLTNLLLGQFRMLVVHATWNRPPREPSAMPSLAAFD